MLSEDELKSKRCTWQYCPLRSNGPITAASTAHRRETICIIFYREHLFTDIAVSFMHFDLKWPVGFSIEKERLWETYRAFLLHLQNIVDVILLRRASGPLPLQTQPGHPRHLQLWREGWQWHTAWGEQVHHFTELAGEGRERQRMGENGRKRQERQGERHACAHRWRQWMEETVT